MVMFRKKKIAPAVVPPPPASPVAPPASPSRPRSFCWRCLLFPVAVSSAGSRETYAMLRLIRIVIKARPWTRVSVMPAPKLVFPSNLKTLESNPPKDKCYLMVAENTGDLSACDKIKGGLMS